MRRDGQTQPDCVLRRRMTDIDREKAEDDRLSAEKRQFYKDNARVKDIVFRIQVSESRKTWSDTQMVLPGETNAAGKVNSLTNGHGWSVTDRF